MRGGGTGERYWDGKSWTGEARGLVFDLSPQPTNVSPVPVPVPVPVPAPAPVSPYPIGAKPSFTRGKAVAIIVAAVVAALVVAVGVAVASSPHRVEVPSVIEMTETDAVSAIRELGLEVVVTYYHNSLPAGRVINVTPRTGTLLDPGESTQLVVSLGPDNPEPSAEEKGACKYARSMFGGEKPSTVAEAQSFLRKAASTLTAHAGAVRGNPVLQSALDVLADDLALAVDGSTNDLPIPTRFVITIERDQQAVFAACSDLGL